MLCTLLSTTFFISLSTFMICRFLQCFLSDFLPFADRKHNTNKRLWTRLHGGTWRPIHITDTTPWGRWASIHGGGWWRLQPPSGWAGMIHCYYPWTREAQHVRWRFAWVLRSRNSQISPINQYDWNNKSCW